jgi:hypothetical protein
MDDPMVYVTVEYGPVVSEVDRGKLGLAASGVMWGGEKNELAYHRMTLFQSIS